MKASGISLQDFDRTGVNRDSPLGGHTQSNVHTGTQGEGAVTPYKTEPDLPASVGGSPAEVGAAVTHHWDKDTGNRSSVKYSLV